MPAVLFANTDKREGRLIAALTWANPFAPERQELQREFAGGPVPEDILERLTARCAQLLERARPRYLGNFDALAPQERDRYQELVFFHLFHRFAPQFQDFIEKAWQHGNSLSRVSFYDTFVEEAGHWLPRGLTGPFAGVGWPRLFACFFQVRRAFAHIRDAFDGESEAVCALRARVWQSIFTRDMARYQRVLAGRLQDVATLITGPSGTGKDLVATAVGLSLYIPFQPNLRQFLKDFLFACHPVNVSALSSTLIESELFGHRKGAFTGALQDRKGYFEVCGEHGTIFLDEIGETGPAIQVKLLRVLQGRQFVPIGDTTARNFEGKIIAATNRDLAAELAAGRFREDLYFRLCADRIETPALADILAGDPAELERLVTGMCARIAGEEGPALAAEALPILRGLGSGDAPYAWPGNFRELEQALRNILVHGAYVPERLPPAGAPASGLHALGAASPTARPPTAAELVGQYARRTYEAQGGNIQRTADILQIDRRTLKKHLEASAKG